MTSVVTCDILLCIWNWECQNTFEARLPGVGTPTWYNIALCGDAYSSSKRCWAVTQDYDWTNTRLCSVRLIGSDSLGFLHFVLLYTTDISVVCPSFTSWLIIKTWSSDYTASKCCSQWWFTEVKFWHLFCSRSAPEHRPALLQQQDQVFSFSEHRTKNHPGKKFYYVIFISSLCWDAGSFLCSFKFQHWEHIKCHHSREIRILGSTASDLNPELEECSLQQHSIGSTSLSYEMCNNKKEKGNGERNKDSWDPYLCFSKKCG